MGASGREPLRFWLAQRAASRHCRWCGRTCRGSVCFPTMGGLQCPPSAGPHATWRAMTLTRLAQHGDQWPGGRHGRGQERTVRTRQVPCLGGRSKHGYLQSGQLRTDAGPNRSDSSLAAPLLVRWETPRLCRGGSKSLTYTGVSIAETFNREPPSKRKDERAPDPVHRLAQPAPASPSLPCECGSC